MEPDELITHLLKSLEISLNKSRIQRELGRLRLAGNTRIN